MKVLKSYNVYVKLFFKKSLFFLEDQHHRGVTKLVTFSRRQKYVNRYVETKLNVIVEWV